MSYQIDIYDDQYNFIGTNDNKIAHQQGLWHRVFTCQFYNSHKRATYFQRKKPGRYSFDRPNYLDITVGGHYEAGEKIQDGIRELYEETALTESQVCFSDLLPLGIRQTAATISSNYIANEFQHIFLYDYTGSLEELVKDNSETSGYLEVLISDVIELLTNKRDSIDCQEAYFEEGSIVVTHCKITLNDFIPSYLKIDQFALRLMIAASRAIDGCEKGLLFW